MAARTTTAGVFLAILWGLTSAAQAQVGNTMLPPESLLNRHGLTRMWWGQATMNSGRDKLEYLTFDGERIYMQTSNGIVSAFDAENGKRLWATTVGAADRPNFPATFDDDWLFIINGASLYGVKKKNGDVLWELRLPGPPSASPSPSDKQIYVGLLDGSVYAFQMKKIVGEGLVRTRRASLKQGEFETSTSKIPTSIEGLHEDNLLPEWGFRSLLWRYKTSLRIVAPPVPVADRLLFVSENGTMYHVNRITRDLVYRFKTKAPLSAPLTMYKSSILLASEDLTLYSVDLARGGVRWQYIAGLPIQKQPLVVADEVFLMPSRGGMLRLSADKGDDPAVFWRQPLVDDVVSISPERVYATDSRNNLVLLARQTGAELGAVPLPRFSKHLQNTRNDRLYMATEAGLVIALCETSREFPFVHQDVDLQPVMPTFTPEGEAGGTPEATPPAPGNTEPESKPEAESKGEAEPKSEVEAKSDSES
ncbi:MAG: PQQ-binding-like beta-propeller repeat protein [Planctomycetales bacterium]|nr:PQQ-binding-like beta-propeller repeat protein [Planctomycetales bacterium]